MKLYTVQHINQYNLSKIRGYLEGSKEHIFEHFLDPYHWMMNMMKQKMVNYNDEYPIWYTPDLKFAKRIYHNDKKNNDVILLEVELNNDEYLISDYTSWHMILNDSYLSLDEEEFDNMEDCSDEEKQKSWERIFDLELLKKYPDWLGNIEKQYVSGRIDFKRFKVLKSKCVQE